MKVRKKDFEVRKNLSFAPWRIHISSGENLNLLKKSKKGQGWRIIIAPLGAELHISDKRDLDEFII